MCVVGILMALLERANSVSVYSGLAVQVLYVQRASDPVYAYIEQILVEFAA